MRGADYGGRDYALEQAGLAPFKYNFGIGGLNRYVHGPTRSNRGHDDGESD
jgi:hypothetical protein